MALRGRTCWKEPTDRRSACISARARACQCPCVCAHALEHNAALAPACLLWTARAVDPQSSFWNKKMGTHTLVAPGRQHAALPSHSPVPVGLSTTAAASHETGTTAAAHTGMPTAHRRKHERHKHTTAPPQFVAMFDFQGAEGGMGKVCTKVQIAHLAYMWPVEQEGNSADVLGALN